MSLIAGKAWPCTFKHGKQNRLGVMSKHQMAYLRVNIYTFCLKKIGKHQRMTCITTADDIKTDSSNDDKEFTGYSRCILSV